MEASNAERSKLVQKQKQQRNDLEKKIKKLKGAMKEAAQKELEELDTKHEEELREFDQKSGRASGGGGYKAAEAPVAGGGGGYKASEAPVAEAAVGNFKERNWSGLSKKELEEACVERGLGKKGSKEDLITKLINFHQEQKLRSMANSTAKAEGKADSKEDDEPTSTTRDEEDDEDEEDEDESESDEEEQDEVDAEEMERQGKREKAIQKAIKFILTEKCPDGFPLAEFEKKLEIVKVTGFAPEKCGYRSIEKFIRGQPEKVLRYVKKTQMILPPK